MTVMETPQHKNVSLKRLLQQHFANQMTILTGVKHEKHMQFDLMAHLIANTFIRLLWKDIPTSPLVGKKCPMTTVSKSESNDKEFLHGSFFWTDVKEIITSISFLWKNATSTYQLT
jgi:hypothetical protein